ncbi:hypothetical protein QN277_020072 [Acacia crassicarpa]|uniref:S-adenosyl-L-methionine-dependent methyltransferase n=1 Tax=Acacia crassicarpa TaxID=499986 RepID=A0AAE1JKR7_9FABA|nr:hypothetical protein QN277_020072 [Acacia crassicarpa]
MPRRPAYPARISSGGGNIPFMASIRSKSRNSPFLSIGLVVLGAILLIGYCYSNSGGANGGLQGLSKLEGGASCTLEVIKALPVLKKAYGDRMQKVLHVGPDTFSVVSSLLTEEDTEAWGIEPYDLDEVDAECKSLVHRGIVRVADIKFPLPYRGKSFSIVIVSEALDYLSPRYLNQTLPELVRVSTNGVVIFTGYPGEQLKAGSRDVTKFGRPTKLRNPSWWIRFFVKNSLEENEVVGKKFEQASLKSSYTPACQVFHLKSFP